MAKSQEDEIYQEASTSVADYVQNATPVKKQKRRRSKKTIIIILILLLLTGGAAYYFLIKDPDKQPEQTQATQQPTQTNEVQAPVETEHYVSQDLKLAFDYPNNWTLDDSTTGQISVTSPKTKIKTVDGQTIDAQAELLVRSKSLPLNEFDGASPVAAMTSEKFAYSQPTTNQRQETFLSIIRFGVGDSGFDHIYITGDSGYQAGAQFSEADLAPVEPIISVNLYGCNESSCQTEILVANDEWNSNNLFQTIKSIFQSFTIN